MGTTLPTPRPPAPAPAPMHGTGFAVTSMVLGILALVFSFIPFVNVVTFPLAVIALPFGGIGMTRRYQGHGMAIAGLVTSIVAIAVAVLMLVAVYNS